jgi:hypothetical protein
LEVELLTRLKFALKTVMPGLEPGIHAFADPTWMAGSSPAMTRAKVTDSTCRVEEPDLF